MEIKTSSLTLIICIFIIIFEYLHQNTNYKNNKKWYKHNKNVSYLLFILNIYIILINIYHSIKLINNDKFSLGIKIIIILLQLWIIRVQIQGYNRIND